MRIIAILVFGLILPSCAQMAARQARDDATACFNQAKATAEGQFFSSRAWQNNGSDTAEKLTDSRPLSQDNKSMLIRYHSMILPCRQIIINHDDQYAAWETPYWQELFQRSDAIYTKLVAGEITFGTANRLYIESNGKFQVDVSRGRADAVRIEEARQQRAAEALLQASATMAAAQRTTTTNCVWIGNMLNCTSR